jgi:hypothetical protein
MSRKNWPAILWPDFKKTPRPGERRSQSFYAPFSIYVIVLKKSEGLPGINRELKTRKHITNRLEVFIPQARINA